MQRISDEEIELVLVELTDLSRNSFAKAIAEAQLAADKKVIEQMFTKVEEMELIKNHNHKKGEVKLVSCARCTYEAFKKKVTRGG